MSTSERGPVRRQGEYAGAQRASGPPPRAGAPRSGGAAAKKRALGSPDAFVWAPVLALFLAAGICMTIGQSMTLTVILVVVAVVLVLADMWINR
ncbi:hypothetical protein ACWDOP_32505 [Nocardia sp. NPDC003693]